MPTPLLPPRGIFVPTCMIFNQQLPAAVLVTWIQLRSLAWSGWVTPPLSLPELASLTGIHPARLNRHLSQLHDISALSWSTSGNGKIILSFPEEPSTQSENHLQAQNHMESQSLTSTDQGAPDHPSYFPHQIMGYLSFERDLDGFSDDILPDNSLSEAASPGVVPFESDRDLAIPLGPETDIIRKSPRYPSQLNQPGGHAYP